ncbi:MAG: ribosome small subunit-dependent GTPase A [Clostridiales bacterium]|nr:ribosome small subunit-dependent GTPase A [Clostridiales bacterium]
MKGKIIKGIGGFYYVKAADNTVYECKARGIFRKDGIKPYIGDDVEIETDGEKGSIKEILPRRNSLIRPPVANIDLIVIVAAAANPEPNLFMLDKLLVSAEINEITPIILINKTDIKDGSEIFSIYKETGYTVLSVCAAQDKTLSCLIPFLEGKTAAFAGLSGVGKSTILNTLTGNELETGSVSEKIKRGRHTTRHVELMELKSGGHVLDTPGFSSFEISGIKSGELYKYFPEIRRLSGMCRFKGCSHINEPDCTVKEHVENGRIAVSRYESYKELYNQLRNVKEWE